MQNERIESVIRGWEEGSSLYRRAHVFLYNTKMMYMRDGFATGLHHISFLFCTIRRYTKRCWRIFLVPNLLNRLKTCIFFFIENRRSNVYVQIGAKIWTYDWITIARRNMFVGCFLFCFLSWLHHILIRCCDDAPTHTHTSLILRALSRHTKQQNFFQILQMQNTF